MPTARASLALRYTPPGGPQITPTFVVDTEYVAQSIGTLDIPDATADETEFTVPFGSVNNVKAIGINNRSGAQLGVRFGAADADEFSIAAGSLLFLAMPTNSPDTALTAVTVVTTGAQEGDGEVDYWVFGDTPTP